MNDSAPTRAEFAVIERSDARWVRLRELIERHSLKRGDFTLSSGGKSTFLFQLRQTTMLPEGAKILGDVIVDFMRRHDLRCVGGLAVGAVPMVSAVSVMSDIKGFPIDAFFVRKEAKSHGALERIDGFVSNGGETLLIDDVATSGNSIIKAMEGMRAEHPTSFARKALVVIDREEGARENLAARGLELYSIFTRRDFNI
jgi:orotate phosphoribosyltransferase